MECWQCWRIIWCGVTPGAVIVCFYYSTLHEVKRRKGVGIPVLMEDCGYLSWIVEGGPPPHLFPLSHAIGRIEKEETWEVSVFPILLYVNLLLQPDLRVPTSSSPLSFTNINLSPIRTLTYLLLSTWYSLNNGFSWPAEAILSPISYSFIQLSYVLFYAPYSWSGPWFGRPNNIVKMTNKITLKSCWLSVKLFCGQ